MGGRASTLVRGITATGATMGAVGAVIFLVTFFVTAVTLDVGSRMGKGWGHTSEASLSISP